MSRAIAILLAVALAAALAYAWQLGGGAGDDTDPSVATSDAQRPGAEPTTTDRAGAVTDLSPGWERLSCRLRDHRNNDGDSFHARCGDRELEFRLYFVDAPESSFKRYRDGNNNGKRLAHQATYFGVDRDAVIAVGAAAKRWTAAKLRPGPFVVLTRWEAVYDSGRFYAMVDAGGGYLSEQLVRNGLARIYTVGRDGPRGRTAADTKRHLRALQAEAKRQTVGGWAR